MGEQGDSRAALIPAGLHPGAYPCLRSLHPRGIRTVVASEWEHTPVFSSKYCDEKIVTPSPYDDLLEYRDALLDIAARPDVRTILPVREEDVYLLSKYYEAFDEHVSLVVPPIETLHTVHDRLRLFEAATEAGVPVPRTRLLTEIDEWDHKSVVKSRYNVITAEYDDDRSRSPSDSDKISTIEYLQPGVTPDLNAICEEMRHVPIVQEFVPKKAEYMFAALYDRGEPLATFQHRQLRGNSYSGGGSVYRESVYVPELEETARKLLDHLDWHGLACIEYIEDANTGEFKLAEINPRIWQSLPLTVRANADFPYYYWLQAMGESDLIEPGYEVGVGSHFLYGELGYLLSVLREDAPFADRPTFQAAVWDLVSSWYEHPQFDYLRLDDPKPFVRGVYNAVRP